jgi:hypothetical protein
MRGVAEIAGATHDEVGARTITGEEAIMRPSSAR